MQISNTQPGKFVDFDYMVVNSTFAPPDNDIVPLVAPPIKAPTAGSTSDDSDTSQAPASPEHGPSLTLPQMVGTTVGAVIGTLALVLAAFVIWRRRLSRQQQSRRHSHAIEKMSAIDLTGDEVHPYTAYPGISPITMARYDEKISPGFPTPLRTAAAFFPYMPVTPPTADSSRMSAPQSSSLGRGRDVARQAGGARSETSGGVTDDTDPSRSGGQASDAGTFGPVPAVQWRGGPSLVSESGPVRGSTVNIPPPVPTSRTSFASLVRMYHHTRSSSNTTPERLHRRTGSEMTDTTYVNHLREVPRKTVQ